MDSIFGAMGQGIMDNLKRDERAGMDILSIQQENNIWDISKMGYMMDQVLFSEMDRLNAANLKMAKLWTIKMSDFAIFA